MGALFKTGFYLKLFLIVAIAIFFIMQFNRLSSPYVISDEAYYALKSWLIFKDPASILSEETYVIYRPVTYPIYPPLLPALFAPLNLLFEPMAAFRLGVLLFSLIAIFLTYLIGKKLFNPEVGTISAVLLAFSATFFYFSTRAFLDIPLLAMVLIAFLLVLDLNRKKIVLLALVFAGIFFLKTEGLITMPAIALVAAVKYKEKINVKKIFLIICALLLLFILFMQVVPGGPGAPNLTWLRYIQSNPLIYFWLFGQQLIVYTLGYALIPFLILGFYCLHKEGKEKLVIPLVLIYATIAPFFLFDIINSRYFIPAIPAFCFVAAYGITKINLPKLKSNYLLHFAITAIICTLLIQFSTYLRYDKFDCNDYTELRQWLEQNISSEDNIVLFSNSYDIRGIGLQSYLVLDKFNKVPIRNPGKQEFESLLQNCRGSIFAIYDEFTTQIGLPPHAVWVFLEEGGAEAYLNKKGFQKVIEMRQKAAPWAWKGHFYIFRKKC